MTALLDGERGPSQRFDQVLHECIVVPSASLAAVGG